MNLSEILQKSSRRDQLDVRGSLDRLYFAWKEGALESEMQRQLNLLFTQVEVLERNVPK